MKETMKNEKKQKTAWSLKTKFINMKAKCFKQNYNNCLQRINEFERNAK